MNEGQSQEEGWVESARSNDRLSRDLKAFTRWLIVTVILVIMLCCGMALAIAGKLQ